MTTDPDDRGHQPEQDPGVPEGGVHRVVPLGALTRLGCSGTYWAVWSTMIWLETKRVPREVPDHDHRDVGLEELGRVAVLTTSTCVLGTRRPRSRRRRRGGAPMPGTTRPSRRNVLVPSIALLRQGLVDGLEVVERTAEALHEQEAESGHEHGTDHPQAPAAGGRRRDGAGRRSAGVAGDRGRRRRRRGRGGRGRSAHGARSRVAPGRGAARSRRRRRHHSWTA